MLGWTSVLKAAIPGGGFKTGRLRGRPAADSRGAAAPPRTTRRNPLSEHTMRHPQWEYTTALIEVGGWVSAKVDPAGTSAELNRYGAEGWELVSAFDVNEGHGRSSKIVALFKRPRP